MRDQGEYQQRAEECLRKAEIAGTASDRAGWLKLAEDWKSLSRIPFRRRTDFVARGTLANEHRRARKPR
jgi:hypothetical protein